MSFSRIELQAVSARATHECDRTDDRLLKTAYIDLQVAVDYLDELLAHNPSQRSLFEEVSV